MFVLDNRLNKVLIVVFFWLSFCIYSGYTQNKEWLHFSPESNLNNGKKIVLISGDEEYRSEETMPMLANILTKKHGFETVVLFSINPKTKRVDPDYQNNIPGLGHLVDADLMIIATRFRELPDDQMKYINEYLKLGKPIIGLRTSTHAFNFKKESNSKYRHYSYNENDKVWKGGFGQQILGETWVSHHGDHGTEGARALINGLESNHPILKGVKDIWVPSDVYGIGNKLEGANILLYGQPTTGMTASSTINIAKSIMPIAWVKSYQLPDGKTGKVFTTTMGASIDFLSKDLRRLVINACYWSIGDGEEITEDFDVEPITTYSPTMFGFGAYRKNLLPQDFNK